MKRNCSKFFILTFTTRPGETPVRDIARPGTLGVVGSLGGPVLEEHCVGEMALANTVAASTKALVRLSYFGRLDIGAPMIIGTFGGVSRSSWVPQIIIQVQSLYCGAE